MVAFRLFTGLNTWEAPLSNAQPARERRQRHAHTCRRSSRWSKKARRVTSFTTKPKPPRPQVSGWLPELMPR